MPKKLDELKKRMPEAEMEEEMDLEEMDMPEEVMLV
jgi:hypothetical protein